MSKTAKRTISLILSVFMAIAAAFVAMPPASASAASAMITYKITYTSKYAKVTFTPKNSSNTIYYTTNGTQPTTGSAKYTNTLAAGKSVLIRAAEYNKNGAKVATIRMTLCPRVLTPKVTESVSGGVKYLTVTTSTANAVIYYTTDGTTPTQKSTKYTGKIKAVPGTVYTFRGFRSGFTSSQTASYTAKAEETAAPASVSEEEKVLEIINKERAAVGAGALKLDETLCKAAAIRAQEVVQKFSHERPDGTRYVELLESLGIKNIASAENIAEGYLSAEEVMKGWMNSSGHRKNILNTKYTHVGIALYVSGGRCYWVQIFGKL